MWQKADLVTTLASHLHYLSYLSALSCDKQDGLGFTKLLENLTQLDSLAQILAGFGVITVLLAILKRNAERRCWRNFKVRVDDWTNRLHEAERRLVDLDDDEWKAECERMLTDSKFSPLEIIQILDASVIVAKGIAANKFLT